MSHELQVMDIHGKSVGTVTLRPEIFDVPVKKHVVKTAVVALQSRQHQGSFSTKTRGEVSGGGRKPWKQKGTGRARQGSIRAPHWRGGGVIFGPKPRSMELGLTDQVRQLAMKMALTDKVKGGRVKVVDQIALAEPKTKAFVALLESWGLTDSKSYVVLSQKNNNVARAASNLSHVKLSNGAGVNLLSLIDADWLVITKDALEKINQ